MPPAYTLPGNVSRSRPGVRSKPSQVQCTSPLVSTEATYLFAGSRYRRCTAARCTVFMVILCVTVGWERCYSSSHPSNCELVFIVKHNLEVHIRFPVRVRLSNKRSCLLVPSTFPCCDQLQATDLLACSKMILQEPALHLTMRRPKC
jgi:hypothetical protein